jgi:hypothetical protein
VQQSILHKGLPKDQWVTPEQVRLRDVLISASRSSTIGADHILFHLLFQSTPRLFYLESNNRPHPYLPPRFRLTLSTTPNITFPLPLSGLKSTGHPIHDPLRPPSRSREQRAGILRQHRGREEKVDVLPYSKRMICGGAVGNGCRFRCRAQKLCRVIYITISGFERYPSGRSAFLTSIKKGANE